MLEATQLETDLGSGSLDLVSTLSTAASHEKVFWKKLLERNLRSLLLWGDAMGRASLLSSTYGLEGFLGRTGELTEVSEMGTCRV